MHNPQTSSMTKLVFINGTKCEFKEGESVLRLLQREIGPAEIPTLCDTPHLNPGGSCRLCSVELSKKDSTKRKIVASCHTYLQDGDQIYTGTDRIKRLRKNIVELILSDYPMDSLSENENSQLQSVAASVGFETVRYPKGKTHFDYKQDLSHPYLTSDLSKCINCNLCIRACDEVQGEFILSMAGRGFDSRVIKSMDTSFKDSDCVSCGACVQVCPTGAIADIFAPLEKETDKKIRTICTYCGVGCNLEVAVDDDKIVRISAPYEAETNQGHTCVKGRYAFQFYNHPDRLSHPMIRKNGELVASTWEEAYAYIIENLGTIKSRFGPDAIAGISSARCTNEENYLMQKMMRAVIGTNNIDGCARICHAPTAAGMQRAFGTGAATNSIADINHTDCMLIVGANPTNAHPVTGAKIKQAAIQGKTLIVIDPRKTDLARYANYHLALRPGTNVALLNMMFWYILDEGLVDQDFINARCEGYPEFKNKILNLDIDQLENICGVDRHLVKAAATAYASAPTAMSFHGLGVTEHAQGTFGVMLVANLAMLTGNIGKPGSGVNPLRGQNNVQGAADMGVQPHQGPGYFDMSDPIKRGIYEGVYHVDMPSRPGLTIPKMFESALAGKLKALWIMGEDVVQTEPNSEKVKAGLRQLDLLVVQELFLSATTPFAHVVLPAASFFEKNGTFTNGERRIQKVNQVIRPREGVKSDGQIAIDIMNQMGYNQPDYHPEWVLDEIASIVPFFRGVSWEGLGENGLQWPVHADGTDTKILHTESFSRGKGKIHFIDFNESPEIIKHAKEFPFILTTNRSLEHYNSGSMTRRTNENLLVYEDILLVNKKDAQAKNLANNDWVIISSPRGSTKIRIKISDQVKPGIVSTTFHFPEILINKITSDVLDSEADCPEYKVVAVDLERL